MLFYALAEISSFDDVPKGLVRFRCYFFRPRLPNELKQSFVTWVEEVTVEALKLRTSEKVSRRIANVSI